jgi:predicted O-methyltransferase YrrM
MWPSILRIQPIASLHIYADVNGKWANENSPEQMVEIRRLLGVYGNTHNITYHGWVDKKTLANAWDEAGIWFYPCIFMETFCLTALEAARSKTLVVTNNLAALQNTVADRGLVIPIEKVEDVMTQGWQKRALDKMMPYLTGETDETNLITRNYEWSLNRSWENRATDMLDTYILTEPYQYKGLYNWVSDVPVGHKQVFMEMIGKFNESRREKPRVLEVGVYTGMSLIEIMRQIPGSVGTAIDSWKKYDETQLLESMDELKVEDSFRHNISTAGLTDRVTVYKGDSNAVLMNLVTKNTGKFDFIYIDGSHLALDCYLDMTLAFQLLEKGGMMVIDDYVYNLGKPLESPYEGVNRFLYKYEGQYQIISKSYRVFLVKM